MRVDPKHKTISISESLVLGVLMFACGAVGYTMGAMAN